MAAVLSCEPNAGDKRDLGDEVTVQVVSDLHLEFYDVLPPFDTILVPSAPVLGLLGDISALGKVRGRELYKSFVAQCAERFDLVIVILGNHEYYTSPSARMSVDQIHTFAHDVCAKLENVHFLHNDVLEWEGVRFLGSVLWSCIPELQTIKGAKAQGKNPMSTLEYRMNDYRLIYIDDRPASGDAVGAVVQHHGPQAPHRQEDEETKKQQQQQPLRKLTAAETHAWHLEAVRFIEAEALKADQDDVPLVVFTHHTPTFQRTSSPEFGSDPQSMSAAFSSDLERFLREPEFRAVRLWCYGHTHFNNDQVIGHTRVLSNQRGYPPFRRGNGSGEGDGYDPTKVVSVPRGLCR